MQAARARRAPLVASGAIEALRLCHGAVDGAPGVTLDAYGGYLVVAVPSELASAAVDVWLDAAAALGARGVYLKRRPREAGRLGDEERLALAPPHALRGSDAPEAFVLHEHGLAFEVRLGAGLQTGLFLDQRDNRARVRARAAERRVANLFGYTGAFTIAAARGGATRTVTVDVSAPALAWAEHNLVHNACSGPQHALLREDARRWLARACRRAARDPSAAFDLVVLDPPSFATTQHGRFTAEHDYAALAQDALSCLAPGGALFACVNHQGIDAAHFLALLHQARDAASALATAPEARARLAQARFEPLPPPADFAPARTEAHASAPAMQSVLVTLP